MALRASCWGQGPRDANSHWFSSGSESCWGAGVQDPGQPWGVTPSPAEGGEGEPPEGAGSHATSLWGGPCRDLPSRSPSPACPASCCVETMGSWRAGVLLAGSPCGRVGVLGRRREWRVSPAACLPAAWSPSCHLLSQSLWCGFSVVGKEFFSENTGLSCRHQIIGLVTRGNGLIQFILRTTIRGSQGKLREMELREVE